MLRTGPSAVESFDKGCTHRTGEGGRSGSDAGINKAIVKLETSGDR